MKEPKVTETTAANLESHTQCLSAMQQETHLPLHELVGGVFVATFKLTPIPSVADSTTSALRREIWQNDIRNAAIVDVARAIVEGSAERLHTYHIGNGKLPEELAGVRWLAILVQNREHALTIHRLLPACVLEYAAAGELIHNASMVMPLLTVSTEMAAHLGRQFTPDVVINAVGGLHMLDPRRLVPPDTWGSHRVAIVEMADEFNQDATEATKKRLLQYALQRVRVFDPGNRIGFDQSRAVFATGANRSVPSAKELLSELSRPKGRRQRKARRKQPR